MIDPNPNISNSELLKRIAVLEARLDEMQARTIHLAEQQERVKKMLSRAAGIFLSVQKADDVVK